jgi:hypothetical protein
MRYLIPALLSGAAGISAKGDGRLPAMQSRPGDAPSKSHDRRRPECARVACEGRCISKGEPRVQGLVCIIDADPQVTGRKGGVFPDREAAEASAALVKHPGGNQAERGLAVEAAAKRLSCLRHCVLETAARAVIQPEDP